MSIQLTPKSTVNILLGKFEDEAVVIAAFNLKGDIEKVLNCEVSIDRYDNFNQVDNAIEAGSESGLNIIIATNGSCDNADSALFTNLPKAADGKLCKEGFSIYEKKELLFICGADRRGTIYGIYDFCEYILGVSPWFFMADVPVRAKEKIVIETDFLKADYPEIEYRGIFINDEEELENWVQSYMGEDTIGVKTYEKIFELLLRLKLNYIWPAMHVNSFNLIRANGELADKMGIVVGTSHCDMLMRSNYREWEPWLKKKGYEGVSYDFSIPGRNREILKEYWKESVEQNKDFEVTYTLGMRGIHDSGFETESLKGLEGKELLDAKIGLLEEVIGTQKNILEGVLGKEKNKDTLKIFVPYKEVLELYDNGLNVPEDLTLIWCNDNYGHVRRYPDETAQKRPAGNGIYYHNSYWAPPGASYLFICSIPMAMTRNELLKAYENNIRKLWVTNFGAIKPLEQQLSYYAQLCWDADRKDAPSSNPCEWLEKWLDRTFEAHFGDILAPPLIAFDQLTNTRKIEQMDTSAFSQDAYGDEAADRLHRYEEIIRTADRIYEKLPEKDKAAFFQIVLLKLHAAYYTNAMYYYADRSNLCMEAGKASAASEYTRMSLEYDHARRALLEYYNHEMSEGKWNKIVTPEDYPPPRTAMHPACMPPLHKGKEGIVVTSAYNMADAKEEKGQNAEIRLEFNYGGKKVKSFELANPGEGIRRCNIITPDWISLINVTSYKKENNKTIYDTDVKVENKILIKINWEKILNSKDEFPKNGILETILVKDLESGDEYDINVSAKANIFANYKDSINISEEEFRKQKTIFLNDKNVEDDGRIVIEGTDYILEKGFKIIPYLGRDKGELLEAGTISLDKSDDTNVSDTDSENNNCILFGFYCYEESTDPVIEIHRFPSLNSVSEISCDVVVDGSKYHIIADSNDEYRGTWKTNIRNGVDKLYLQAPKLSAGFHTIELCNASRYFAFSRIVVYTRSRKENSLGAIIHDERLPEVFDIHAKCVKFYGKKSCELSPRPVYYLKETAGRNTVLMEDELEIAKNYGKAIKIAEILAFSNKIVNEKTIGESKIVHIEAASALGETSFAWTSGTKWQYCNSPSHGETGLAMYIRKENMQWLADKNAPALHYRFNVSGGDYKLWIRLHMWGNETSNLTIGVDGDIIDPKEMFGGIPIWRYSNENIWKWIPLMSLKLSEGEHELAVICLSSHLRIEQIYLTSGDEKPPLEYSV